METSKCNNSYFKQLLTETTATSTLSHINQTDFKIIYEAHFIADEYFHPFTDCVQSKKIEDFLELVEDFTEATTDGVKSYRLLKAAFHNAPNLCGFIGPFYGECFSKKEIYLRYINDYIIDVLDNDHGPMLQVNPEDEEKFRPLLADRSDRFRNWPLTIPEPLKKKLLENGQQQLSEFKKSGHKLDLKPVVKLYRADGAGTWLLSEMHDERPDMAIGLCDRGGGHTVVMEISLSELQEHACKPLFEIELDDSFAPTKTITQYAERAQLDGKLIV